MPVHKTPTKCTIHKIHSNKVQKYRSSRAMQGFKSTTLFVVILLVSTSLPFLEGARSRDDCRCLTASELNAGDFVLKENLEEDIESLVTQVGLANGIADGNATESFQNEYGIGCKAHDAGLSECGAAGKPGEWCDYEWCYVDNGCKLDFEPSRIFKKRSYSYAACGFIDESDRGPTLLNGMVLQGVIHDNHRGVEGTECEDKDNPTQTTCHGTTMDLARYLVEEPTLNITIN